MDKTKDSLGYGILLGLGMGFPIGIIAVVIILLINS